MAARPDCDPATVEQGAAEQTKTELFGNCCSITSNAPVLKRDPAAGECDWATRPARRYGARQKNEER
ncbi:hypothetical protein NDU88_000714 [Pleurodeles waltl]|uniref:Uncharacterized protein n=1 Tax=Pleurodeles waltl TaxID=8319 RepID=A0AAV7TGB3_PLEWA|nr:hypothetical protein NDU88_000714 [Pleurodeles waltl]